VGSLGDSLIGALVGALVGSVLGYVFSYHSARRTRGEDLEERRKRLMRALAHEIGVDMPPDMRDEPTHQLHVTSGVHLATLEPLIDLAAHIQDERLLRALAVLRSRSEDFNDEIQATNALYVNLAMDLTPSAEATKKSALEFVAAEYAGVREAADHVLELLQIPR